MTQLEQPFSEIFVSAEEAQWAFDLMRQALEHVGIDSADDPRYAITSPIAHKKGAIHLNLGGYRILGFRPPDNYKGGLDLIFPEDRFFPQEALWSERFKSTKAHPVISHGYKITNRSGYFSAHRDAFFEAVKIIFNNHKHLSYSNRRSEHVIAIGRAIFDPVYQKHIFAYGIGPFSFQMVIDNFNRAKMVEKVAAAEEKRQQLMTLFPREGWETMPLEKYAQGLPNSRKGYCYMLEFGSKVQLGSISGGTARKFRIYKHGKKKGWYFPKQYDNVESAWSQLRQAFVRLFDLLETGHWEKADAVNELASAHVLRVKSAFIYFPEQLLPIYSYDHLRGFLQAMGANSAEIQGGAIHLNRLLRHTLHKNYPELRDWHPIEIMRLLYQWKDMKEQTTIVADKNELPEITPIPAAYTQIANSLERKGQAILYGPPGTGKTYIARQFALWWLLSKMDDARATQTFNSTQLQATVEHELTSGQAVQRVWWIVANPKEWRWDVLFANKLEQFRYGRLKRNYGRLQAGDLVVGYQSTPDKRIMALARIKQGLHTVDGKQQIELEPVQRIRNGLTYAELKQHSLLSQSEPMRLNCQGTLFALTPDEAAVLFAELGERDPNFDPYVTDTEHVSPLTWTTFHPSYSYEDFVEGFRPQETASGNGLILKLEDGLFKRICRTAQANPAQPYLIIIDEINRANLAKVFGELITLLEKDKRDLTLTLPQSRESFSVPPNVYLLGTMNTADRSIKLLDSALRRRFAFIEMMPDDSLLRGHQVGELALDKLLLALNARIMQREGREKQLGHALFLVDGKPVVDRAEFGRIFRQDIVPLLQEYCYEDYHALADLIGTDLVNVEQHTFQPDYADDASLLTALAALITNP